MPIRARCSRRSPALRVPFERSSSKVWHAINLAAVLHAARRGGVELDASQGLDGTVIARGILVQLDNSQQTERDVSWSATKAEAHVALGERAEAAPQLRKRPEHSRVLHPARLARQPLARSRTPPQTARRPSRAASACTTTRPLPSAAQIAPSSTRCGKSSRCITRAASSTRSPASSACLASAATRSCTPPTKPFGSDPLPTMWRRSSPSAVLQVLDPYLVASCRSRSRWCSSLSCSLLPRSGGRRSTRCAAFLAGNSGKPPR